MTPFKKIVFIFAVIFPLVLIIHNLSFAQLINIKGIQLNNGSVIYGKVLNMNPDVVRMQTADGKIISVKLIDVEIFVKKTEKEINQQPSKTLLEKTPATKQVDQIFAVESKSKELIVPDPPTSQVTVPGEALTLAYTIVNRLIK